MYLVTTSDSLSPKKCKTIKSLMSVINEETKRLELPVVDTEFVKVRLKLNTRMKLKKLPNWLVIERVK